MSTVVVVVVSVVVVVMVVVVVTVVVVTSEKLDDSIHVEPIEIYESRGVTYSKHRRCKRDVRRCERSMMKKVREL